MSAFDTLLQSVKNKISSTASRLFDVTPAGQFYNNIQTSVPKIQQGIQNFGQYHPTATNIALKAEPAYNRVQNFMQTIPSNPIQIPKFQLQNPVSNFVANVPSALAEGFVNAPFGMVKGAYQFPQSKTKLEAAGNTAQILNSMMMMGAPKAIPSMVRNATTQPTYLSAGGKLLSAMKAGAVSGAQFGGVSGTLTGMEQAKETQDPIEYLKQVGIQTAGGLVMGGALGGALGGIGEGFKLTKQAIQGGAKNYADEFAPRVLNQSIKDRPIWAKKLKTYQEIHDYLRKNYTQQGAIDFNAQVGFKSGKKKTPSTGGEITLYRGTTSKSRTAGVKENLKENMFFTADKANAEYYAKLSADRTGAKPVVHEYKFSPNEVEKMGISGEWRYLGKQGSGGEIPKGGEIGKGVTKVSTPKIQKVSLPKPLVPEVTGSKIQAQEGLLPPQKPVKAPLPAPDAKLPSKPNSPSTSIIPPQEKYAFNINKKRLQLNPEETKVLDATVKVVEPELSALKGKTLSNKEVLQAAKESEILQKTVSREQSAQAEATLLRARQRVVELDKDITQAVKTGNTDVVQAKMKEYVDLLKVVSSNAADRGRQLQSLAIDAGDESVRSTMIKEILKVQSNTDEIIAEATRVDWNNANKVAEFYRKYIKPSKLNILDEFRYNNMLSNPRTHIRNAFSNIVQTVITRPLTLVAQGKPIEALKYYGGVGKSIPDAFDGFFKSFKGLKPIEKPDLKYIPTGKLPKFLTIPTRAMEASDVFFQTLIKGGEVARGATEAQAKNIAEYSLFRQGLKPEGQGAILNAIDNATDGIFQLGHKIPPLRWFVPFIKTPMNFAKQWIEYSPAGALTAIGAGNKREQLAKAAIGSVVVGLGAKAALEDRTTWSAPTDPKQKELFYASGRKPYSIKIGDSWVSMQYAGPLALALALPAAAKYYSEDSRTALTDSQMDKLMNIAMASAEYLSGQTFLEGVGNFVKMASGDIDYTFKKNVAYTASQVIPLQGLVRWISTVIDPVYRKPDGMIEQVQSNIPFASQGLKPYTMPNGEPSTREARNLLTPYDITKERPEYNQPFQERQNKLQENAIKNKLIKDAEAGNIRTQGTLIPVQTKAGNWTTVDTSFQPTKPILTGNTELDKKLISKYKGEITQKANDITALYEAGNIDATEAEKLLQQLKVQSSKLAGPKKVAGLKPTFKKSKRISMKKIKLPKLKKIKVKKIKTLSKSKANLKVLKVKQPKLAKVKLLNKRG